jgi:hypothetical protein
MFTIRQNGKIIAQAKDDRINFTPTYESEKDKPNTLIGIQQEREGLSNDQG